MCVGKEFVSGLIYFYRIKASFLTVLVSENIVFINTGRGSISLFPIVHVLFPRAWGVYFEINYDVALLVIASAVFEKFVDRE